MSPRLTLVLVIGLFILDDVVQWLSMWTQNAVVVSSNLARATIKNIEGNGKPHRETKVHFPRRKLRALSLVSATLEIEYARSSP